MITFNMQASDASPYALVSTVRYLLLVNLYTGSVTPIENSRTEYYGITWRPSSEVLILGHSGADNATFVDASSYARSETGWVSEGSIHSQTFLSQPHQILWGSDGRVICTNTGRNCISIVDLQRPGHFQELRFSAMRWDRLSLDGEKGDHLNSLFEKDGYLYVLAHAYDKGSCVSVLSYPELSPIETWARLKITGLHNIWVESEGRALSCHSSAGAIVDIRNGETLWQAGAPVYTRGLAASADFVCVGESEISGRDLRRSSHSGLWIIDRKSWRTLNYLSLGPYGAVNEVRLVNIPDEAHHGHVFNGWPALLEANLGREISARKLQSAHNYQRTQSIWRGFKDVFGAYTTDDQGSRIAAEDSLCLATFGEPYKAGETFSFGVEYQLNADDGTAHASIILGYQGIGSDTHMIAVLIQNISNLGVCLRVWANDGREWSMVSHPVVSGLPKASHMMVTSDGKLIEICVSHLKVLELPLDSIEITQGNIGLRWIGSKVRPTAFET